MTEGPPRPSTLLEPPHQPADPEDPGAHEAVSDTDAKDFCDASEGRGPSSRAGNRSRTPSPIPRTRVEKVDGSPRDGEVPGSVASQRRASDAVPDEMEITGEEDKITRDEGLRLNTEASAVPQLATGKTVTDDDQFGDDFDAFEDGAGDGGQEDDFGDFDDAFEEPASEAVTHDTAADQQPIPSLLNFDSISSLSDLLAATTGHLDTLFPNSANLSSKPQVEPIPDSSSIFMSERSLSLWSQLVAPPPLQPPNWTKSRIRRLFLVSLGVPVDLDEILPASKQKKLVLPSMNLEVNNKSVTTTATTPTNTTATAAATSDGDTTTRSRSRPKKDGAQRSSRSLDSARSSSRTQGTKRRGHPPPPSLDLSAVHRMCATTDAALDGLTDEEMRAHVTNLDQMTVRASEVLEYWLKRRDTQLGEKEAFEGVIENLVKHARQVRK